MMLEVTCILCKGSGVNNGRICGRCEGTGVFQHVGANENYGEQIRGASISPMIGLTKETIERARHWADHKGGWNEADAIAMSEIEQALEG